MDHYTIIVFCSFSQVESFRSALLDNGCYYVARNFWIKTGNPEVPHNLFKNCIEAYLVAFGTKTTDLTPRDWQINWNVNVDDKSPDAGEVNRRNYLVAGVVERMAYYDGRVRG